MARLKSVEGVAVPEKEGMEGQRGARLHSLQVKQTQVNGANLGTSGSAARQDVSSRAAAFVIRLPGTSRLQATTSLPTHDLSRLRFYPSTVA